VASRGNAVCRTGGTRPSDAAAATARRRNAEGGFCGEWIRRRAELFPPNSLAKGE